MKLVNILELYDLQSGYIDFEKVRKHIGIDKILPVPSSIEWSEVKRSIKKNPEFRGFILYQDDFRLYTPRQYYPFSREGKITGIFGLIDDINFHVYDLRQIETEVIINKIRTLKGKSDSIKIEMVEKPYKNKNWRILH